MNKKLNTIALATALASLGFCGLTYGWQTNSDGVVGSGIASNQIALPPIVSGESLLGTGESNLPPVVTGKLIRQASAQSAPIKELPTFNQGGGLKPLNSILSSEKAPHVYRPPAPPVATKSQAPVARIAAAPATPTPQGSGTRGSIGGGGSSTRSVIDAQGFSGGGGGSSTRSALDAQGFGGSVPSDVYNPTVGDQFNSDPSSLGQPFVNQDFGGGCATCGNSLVDGSCSNCGPGAAFSDGPIIQDFGTFGSVSAARRYLYLDALVWTRADGDIANSNFGTLNDFDFTGGLRVTYGVRDDSTFGREISFLGLPEVDQEISQTDPLGRINIGTIPNLGAPSTAFFNATAQTQTKESDLYSVEFNRVNWGWDLIKTFRGIRYLRFDDSYNVVSTGSTPQFDGTGNVVLDALGQPQFSQGDFTLDASNTLLGAQIGGELFYDIGYRWSASGFSKFGVFANFNDFDFNYTNDDFNASSENDNVTLSTVAELGALAHYQVRTNLRFRAGYSALFVGNVATVADNLGQSAGLFTGLDSTDSDDVFFHGFNFGLEFYR